MFCCDSFAPVQWLNPISPDLHLQISRSCAFHNRPFGNDGSMGQLYSACVAVLMLSGAALAAPANAPAPKAADVLKTYGDIAHAMYEDSLITAKSLQTAVGAFLAEPTAAKLQAARAAWKVA